MNKIAFIFFILIGPFSFAMENIQIELSTLNNLRFKTKYQVKIEKNNIYFDSEKIDQLQLPLLIPSLKVLSHVKSEEMSKCSSGTLIHKVIRGKKISQGVGCLSSKRSVELLIAIDKLKKSKIL